MDDTKAKIQSPTTEIERAPAKTRLSYSLKFLLLVAVALTMGFYAYRMHLREQRLRAFAKILEKHLEGEWSSKRLASLTSLNLKGKPIGDSVLPYLRDLWKLESLDLSDTEITDEGLPVLWELKRLKKLYLSQCSSVGTIEVTHHIDDDTVLASGSGGITITYVNGKMKVTPEALEPLRLLTELEVLDLNTVGIDDEGVAHLASLNQLKELDLSGSKMTQKGLRILEKLPELSRLVLDGTALTGAEIDVLGEFPKLRHLSCASCQISNQGFKSMGRLTELRSLNLKYTPSVESGLGYLHTLKNLQTLVLRDSRYMRSAIVKFKEAVPHCQVRLTR